MDFQLDINEHGSSIIFLLQGKLLREDDAIRLNDSIDVEMSRGFHNLIFDLSDLSSCNSSGLNVLIRALTKTRTKTGDAVVCRASKNVDELFAITKLNEIFSLYTTQKEALQHFKK